MLNNYRKTFPAITANLPQLKKAIAGNEIAAALMWRWIPIPAIPAIALMQFCFSVAVNELLKSYIKQWFRLFPQFPQFPHSTT